jgi:predicted anti-sigma-YlaC factor YlaD
MLNCKQAAALMSQEMDKELGLTQKMGLRFHLMMCSGCRNLNKQMEFLRQSCRKFPSQDS